MKNIRILAAVSVLAAGIFAMEHARAQQTLPKTSPVTPLGIPGVPPPPPCNCPGH